MSSFGLDNPGGGFAVDDDGDLESMLGRAAAASEDDGDLAPSTPQEPVREPEPEPTPQPDLHELDALLEQEATPAAPVPVETPRPPAVEPTPAARQQPMGRVRVPTEAEQLVDAQRIIRILDVYRRLTNDEKSVTVQFVTNGEMDSAEDHVVVVKVINADPTLTATMVALKEAYQCDPVERAFYTMSLETKTLHDLGSLVSVFSGSEYDESIPDLTYSRQVVAAIALLSDREINFVSATAEVLAAAEIPED